MKNVGYREMTKLLDEYEDIKTLAETTQHQLMRLQDELQEIDFDDYVAVSALKRKMVEAPSYNSVREVSDKTGSAAIHYEREIEREYKESIAELANELFVLKTVLEKMNIGLKRLPKQTQKIIILKYFKKMTWKDLTEALLSEGIAQSIRTNHQRERKREIQRLCTVCRVSEYEYEDILKLLGR